MENARRKNADGSEVAFYHEIDIFRERRFKGGVSNIDFFVTAENLAVRGEIEIIRPCQGVGVCEPDIGLVIQLVTQMEVGLQVRVLFRLA